ncbi:MAG: MarR family transcriptional regulator [Spirochaetia bacterium]|jgi:DNA-binding MarR family transcriptional regulator|nr:MarR family transcriptional regulator [Spirochaetia bacterium]
MKTEDMTIEELARTVFHMHGHLIKKEFETRDITRVSHPHMLFMLRFRSKNSQGLSQKDIADRLGVSTPTVAISVKRMEKSGLLCKIPDEHDHRYNLISLTEKGRRLTDEAIEAFDSIDREIFNDFSPEDIAQLKRLLIHLMRNMEKQGIRSPEQLRTDN